MAESILIKTKFQSHEELRPLIMEFKSFYFAKKIKASQDDKACPDSKILRAFQEKIKPMIFNPSSFQTSKWKKKWEKEIKDKIALISFEVPEVVIPVTSADERLMSGSKILAEQLIEDASAMLKNDKEQEDVFTSDELVRRRTYVLNVVKHITKLMQGNRALDIRSNAEKRETAGFLMDILKRSTSGKMTEAEIGLLKSSLLPNKQFENE